METQINEKIIIFGTGEEAKRIILFLKYIGMDDSVLGFCDNNVEGDSLLYGKSVFTPMEYFGKGYSFVIGVRRADYYSQIKNLMDSSGEKYYRNIKEWLLSGKMNSVEYERHYCAFFHMESMEDYYTVAELDENMDIFWGDKSPFYKFFKQLDLNNVIELACGRGRHVKKYINDAEEITLVDILKKNIEYCRERYKDSKKIIYYRNNGFNLEKLASDAYTALFSYDAMVHFEMFDVYEYLNDIYRVLKIGGMALLHHSNYCSDYMASFENSQNNHARSFMSKELLAYLAYKAKFEVVDQLIIDWGGIKNLDCISLIRK